MTATPLIEATGLHTFYGDSHIIHGLDFSVGRGEAVALMGRNGMGKTTLLRSLLGLTPPRRGIVRVNGRDMTGFKPHLIAREGIAFVPEGRGIFPTLSVREHLAMAARAGTGGRRDWTVERVFDIFPRLTERRAHRGAMLSGGEQQMLTIARALVTNPDLLILDEATEGLAPLVAQEIWSTLKLVRSNGIALVIVDKSLAALSAVADRIVILVKGRVALSGAPAALAAEPEPLRRHLGV